MISAQRAGVAAGVAAYLHGLRGDPVSQASRSLDLRKSVGIAHTEPEAEYLQGFVAGFTGTAFEMPDGLCLAEDLARKAVAA